MLSINNIYTGSSFALSFHSSQTGTAHIFQYSNFTKLTVNNLPSCSPLKVFYRVTIHLLLFAPAEILERSNLLYNTCQPANIHLIFYLVTIHLFPFAPVEILDRSNLLNNTCYQVNYDNINLLVGKQRQYLSPKAEALSHPIVR